MTIRLVTVFIAVSGAALGQATARSVEQQVKSPLTHAETVAFQLRRYVAARVPRLRAPASAAEWKRQAAEIREKMLRDVVYHGWPREWIDAPPDFRLAGETTGAGYRLKKYRYSIVPGFETTALLYEPARLSGRAPAILNLNGHEAEGKSTEYIQKRCINQARQGYFALNPEWIGMGELRHPENLHWNAAHLDLAGFNGLGLFYLAMRRALDFLASYPQVDPSRIGATGLSGGGWQTIVLSALDERIKAAVPNAGYFSDLSLGAAENIGDNEQSATDFLTVADYAHLTAMRAPRPTLLIYNAEDDCCFRAARVQPFLLAPAQSVFSLMNAGTALQWYENTDPGTHNYQYDNRMQSYRFFSRYLGASAVEDESPAESQVRTAEEIAAGLPEDNLTIVGLAAKLAAGQRPRTTADDLETRRDELRSLVRYRPVRVAEAWPLANSRRLGVEAVGYRFDFDNDLSAAGYRLRAVRTPVTAPASIIVRDKGRKSAAGEAADRIDRGEQVLLLEPVLTGDSAPPDIGYPNFERMLDHAGERPAAIEASQIAACARWLREEQRAASVALRSTGPRSQIASLVAAALEPSQFREVRIRGGLEAIDDIFSRKILYRDMPEWFILDLHRQFDLTLLGALANSGTKQ